MSKCHLHTPSGTDDSLNLLLACLSQIFSIRFFVVSPPATPSRIQMYELDNKQGGRVRPSPKADIPGTVRDDLSQSRGSLVAGFYCLCSSESSTHACYLAFVPRRIGQNDVEHHLDHYWTGALPGNSAPHPNIICVFFFAAKPLCANHLG